MQLLVIGYGNPLRRDDGIGRILAQSLEDLQTRQPIDVIVSHQLLPEMAEAVSQAERLILIDAVYGGQAGDWSCLPVYPDHLDKGLPTLVHTVSPTHLLALSQILYNRVPIAHIITVVGSDFGYGEGLSEVVQAVIPEIRDFILCLLHVDSVEFI